MDRRSFLKTTSAAAGSSLALTPAAQATTSRHAAEVAAPAVNRGIAELYFASPWSFDVPVLGDSAERLRTQIQLALGDGYQVRPVCSLSGPADFTFAPADADGEPGFAFFAGLPGSYGLAPAHLQAWLAVGGGQMLWDDLAARFGSKPLLAGHTGEGPGIWASGQLGDVSDLAGKQVMLGGLGRYLARALGAEPLDLLPSQLNAALASGRLRAAEWGNPLAGLMLGLPEAATHFYRGGVRRCGVAFALNIRLDVWQRLSTAQQTALEGVAAHVLSLSLAEALAHGRLAEQAMVRRPNLTIAEISAPLAAAVENATAAALDDITHTSPEASRIRDSYLAFRRLLARPGEERLV